MLKRAGAVLAAAVVVVGLTAGPAMADPPTKVDLKVKVKVK